MMRHIGPKHRHGAAAQTSFPPTYPAPNPFPANGSWLSFSVANPPDGTATGVSADPTMLAITKFGTKRQREIQGLSDWHDGDQLATQNEWNFNQPGWKYTKWRGHVELACGGLYGSETWAMAANGDLTTAGDAGFTTRFTNMFNMYNTSVLTAQRSGSLTLCRPFHEMNGNWYGWTVRNADTTNFKAAWARVVALRNSICPTVKLGMSFNAQTANNDVNIFNMIPVDANGHATNIDYLSVDSYNNFGIHSTSDFSSVMNVTTTVNGVVQPYGLETWRQWALQLGVPLVISEWSNPAGTGEAVGWLNGYYAWLKANGGYGPGKVWIESLFNVPGYGSTPAPFGDYMMYDPNTDTISNNQPLTAQRYLDIWGT
jgi:hypothetical protein